MRGPTLLLALCAAGLMFAGGGRRAVALRGRRRAVGAAAARRARAGASAQRAGVLSDLQHTLAGQGIAACSGDAHPAAAPLATLAVELSPDDAAKATVDIEVRDAVTHKRVRRDVDLSRIPDDGRAAAIAIESDELLRASWAEIALDTARARQAQENARPQVVGSVEQVMAPARVGERRRPGRARGGRALLRRRRRWSAPTASGALRLSPRIALEIAGALRIGPSVAAPHGQVSALGAGGEPGAAGARRGRRGGRRWPRARASSAGWLEFRAEPSPAPRASAYGNLLAVGAAAARSAGWRSGGAARHRWARRRRRAARRGGDGRGPGGRERARRCAGRDARTGGAVSAAARGDPALAVAWLVLAAPAARAAARCCAPPTAAAPSSCS